MIPKKVKVIGQSSLSGDLIVTQFEQEDKGSVVMEQKFMKSRNPNKTILWQTTNKFDEKIQLAHYKGNDYINIFVDGGVHSVRFMLTKDGIGQLIQVLKYYIDNLKGEK